MQAKTTAPLPYSTRSLYVLVGESGLDRVRRDLAILKQQVMSSICVVKHRNSPVVPTPVFLRRLSATTGHRLLGTQRPHMLWLTAWVPCSLTTEFLGIDIYEIYIISEHASKENSASHRHHIHHHHHHHHYHHCHTHTYTHTHTPPPPPQSPPPPPPRFF